MEYVILCNMQEITMESTQGAPLGPSQYDRPLYSCGLSILAFE